MEIVLTPEENAFVRDAVDAGRVDAPVAAVHEAMDLWIARERRPFALLESLEAAEASVARGDGTPITRASMATLATEIVDRCAARLRSEEIERR